MRQGVSHLAIPATDHWYLGYDPFTDPELGRPKGNESTVVAFLSSDGSVPIGVALRNHRLGLKKNKKEFAAELGVDVRTLRNWAAGRHAPLPNRLRRILEFLKPQEPPVSHQGGSEHPAASEEYTSRAAESPSAGTSADAGSR